MRADEVARAMLQAVRSRRRDTILTLPGKLMVHTNRFFPWLMDRAAGRMVGPPVGSDGEKQ